MLTNISDPREDVARTRSSSHLRFIVIGIVLIATIVAATISLIFVLRSDAIAAYRTATMNLGNGMSQQTSQAISSIDRALHEIEVGLTSDSVATADAIGLAMQSRASFDLLGSSSQRIPFLDGLAMIDSHGIVQNSFGSAVAIDRDVSQQDFFINFSANNDRNSFVGAPAKSKVNGKWNAILSRRINDPHGAFAGIVAAEISLASIEAFYSGAMPARRSVSLLRRDGMVLVRFPHREEEIGRLIPAKTPWHAAVAQGGGAYHAGDYFTQERIVAFARPLKDLPLVVQASVAETDVLVDWPRQVQWLVLGAAAAIVGLVGLLRHLARQVDRLESSGALLTTKNMELETAHTQLDAALANISLGVTLFDGNKKLIVANQKYRDIYNLPPEATRPGISLTELMDHLFKSSRFPRVGRDEYLSARAEMIESGERKQAVVELISGQTIFVTRQPMPHGGWISAHEDITERYEADRHIRFLAHHDVLTGLSNRAFFTEQLESAVARLQRHGEPFSVFMMDLDKFKNVNDTLGHPAGDELLRETAQRLQSSLRETDVLARLGGDEFAIIQSGEKKPREGATSLAARILKLISQPYDLNGNIVSVGCSIGIALAPEHADNSSDLLKMADLALYAVKEAGRNGFRLFEAEMMAAMDGRRALEDELRLAISRGEFELHYQALIDAGTRRQAGFEALVRWRSPTRGLVMPDKFIPLAEETGLIVPLGEWILQRACLDAVKWPSHIKVAVNLSPVQLTKADLFQSVRHILAASSLPAERLELEITETALFKGDADSVRLIRRLKKLGISIALDDFGTGYSSLTYLTTIPFDKIKIDRSFTMNMIKRADHAAIVAAVIALGRSLKTETVAEGVETEEQFAILRDAGVTLVQGYLFGVPCPASALVLDDADDVATGDSVATAA
jgi:diguanylate cyclase (GGDEF)-like protein